MPNPAAALKSRDTALAASLAKLWPHREHESNWLASLLCFFGLHLWATVDLAGLLPYERDVQFCRCCSAVMLEGKIHHN